MITSTKILQLSCILLLIIAINGQSTFQNPCVSKINCRECIQTKSCAWCTAPSFADKPRCFNPLADKFFPLGSCPEEYVFDPQKSEIHIQNRSLSRGESSGGGRFVEGGSRQESGSSFSSSSSSSSSSSGSYSGSSGSGSWGGSSQGSAVQIWPQRVGLKLRLSEFFFFFNLWFFLC